MREDAFGAPVDGATENELQRLIDKFEWAVCDPDSVASCTRDHIGCPDRVAFNPYRPPRGDEARRQLENINVAEWGAVMLRQVHDGAPGNRGDTVGGGATDATGGDDANLSAPLVLRGHSVRFASPRESQHMVTVANHSSASADSGSGSDERCDGATADAAAAQRTRQPGIEPRGMATALEEPTADAVLDQLAHLLLEAVGGPAPSGDGDAAPGTGGGGTGVQAEPLAPREVLQRRRLLQRTESGEDPESGRAGHRTV
jgi:hypothetical protein